MDNILFECIYTDSEELLRESYRNVREKKTVYLGYGFIFVAVCLLALAVGLHQFGWIVSVFILSGTGVYFLCSPAISARKCIDSIRRINNGTVPSARLVIDDKITHYYKLDTTVILFEHLRFAYFMKHCVVLVGLEGYLTLDRAGFTKGSSEELETHIREKYPHITIVRKV